MCSPSTWGKKKEKSLKLNIFLVFVKWKGIKEFVPETLIFLSPNLTSLIPLVGKRLWLVEHYLSLKKCISIFPILASTRKQQKIFFLFSLTSNFLVNYNIYVIMSFLTHSLHSLVQLKPFWNFIKHKGS